MWSHVSCDDTWGREALLFWQAPQTGLSQRLVPGRRLVCFSLNHSARMAVSPRLRESCYAAQSSPEGHQGSAEGQLLGTHPPPALSRALGSCHREFRCGYALRRCAGHMHTQCKGQKMLGPMRGSVTWASEPDTPWRDNPTSATHQLCDLEQEI